MCYIINYEYTIRLQAASCGTVKTTTNPYLTTITWVQQRVGEKRRGSACCILTKHCPFSSACMQHFNRPKFAWFRTSYNVIAMWESDSQDVGMKTVALCARLYYFYATYHDCHER